GRVLRHSEYVVKITLGHRPALAIRSLPPLPHLVESGNDQRLSTPVARWENSRRHRADGPAHIDQESRLTSRKSASTTSSPLARTVSSSAGCSGAAPLSCCSA